MTAIIIGFAVLCLIGYLAERHEKSKNTTQSTAYHDMAIPPEKKRVYTPQEKVYEYKAETTIPPSCRANEAVKPKTEKEVEVKSAEETSVKPKAIRKPRTKKEKSSKQKGNEFEEFYADIFKFHQIRIKEWNQGTLTKAGAMGENALKPDFFVVQKVGDSELEYWVECKWRKSLDSYKQIPEYQYKRYRDIQRESHRKIFMAIGIGGTPGKPQAVYVVPLDSLPDGKISEEIIAPFRHSDPKMQLSSRVKDYFYQEVFKKKR